jgi:hypothetical protein
MSSITKYRVLGCSLALLLLLALHPVVVLNAQLPDHLRLELLRAQLLGRDFEQRQNDFCLWKLQERRRVPVYNAHLNGVVVDFHNHILKDEHYLTTNCGTCRKYIHEIKTYSRKLEQAMK